MFVPLPTWALDLLISTNLSVAMAILLVVLYVPEAIGIATFPTLLLLTTLFRLALSVSATRLILLQANAGGVIRAFGTVGVRGNYIVGAVLFLVLTTVQFIVMARGSERVAEVAARFALDALPGRQMAIDSELRAGTIDGNEARRRRRTLQRESQFYGAMDGAMKFVKGDVVASLVILVVNILGGLAIGVAMHGMTVSGALRRYGLLTIGDGLVTQIPALALSTAAGILVTRVPSEDAETPLGEELLRQVFGVPKALQAAGGFVLLLAVVPGLPAAPFLVVGVAMWLTGRARSQARSAEMHLAARTDVPPDRARLRGQEPQFAPIVIPWSIDVAADLLRLLDRKAFGLRTETVRMREDFFGALGVPLPAPGVRMRLDLAERHVAISIREVPASVFAVPTDVSDDKIAPFIHDKVLAVLTPRAADFLGLAEVQRMLDEVEQFAPATVPNVVPKLVPLVVLTDVLRRLVDEGVAVRDLRGVIEALSTAPSTEKDPSALAEHVRSQMRRALTFRLTQGRERLDVVLIDPLVEDTIRRGITRTAAGSQLALTPGASRDILASIRQAVQAAQAAGRSPVLLTQPDLRRFVRKLIASDLPAVTVVSFAEMMPEVSINPVAHATPA
jgi:type III secretion protein V